MSRFRVVHETVYAYADTVVTSHNEARLLPRSAGRQVLEHLDLTIDPTPETVSWHRDYFQNEVVFFALREPHQRLDIRTESRVRIEAAPPPEPGASTPWEEVVARVRAASDAAGLEALEFVFDSPLVPCDDALAAFARPSFPAGRTLGDGLLDFSRRIHAEFHYDPEATTLATPVLEVLRERHGVCQDYAHVMIGGLRSLGIPARYVSGYLQTHKEPAAGAAAREDAAPKDDARTDLVGSDASHAWVAAWCPSSGWLEVDPTNDLVPGERHVLLGWGRDYDDVSPVKGVTLGGGAHTVEVGVDVRPL